MVPAKYLNIFEIMQVENKYNYHGSLTSAKF